MRGLALANEGHFFSSLFRQHLGFSLSGDRDDLLQSRLRPILIKHQIASLSALASLLQQPVIPHALLSEVLDAMVTGETYFFRDEGSFHELHHLIIPHLLVSQASSPSCLHIWSAGCSTGQEPYSLAMALSGMADYGTTWQARILASDVSTLAVQRAQSARYSEFEMSRGLSDSKRLRCFDLLKTTSEWQLKEDLRALVSVEQHNLLQPLPRHGPFDLVLCRNVLIYFDTATKLRVLAHLFSKLAPHGLLLLSRSEVPTLLKHGYSLAEGSQCAFIKPEQPQRAYQTSSRNG